MEKFVLIDIPLVELKDSSSSGALLASPSSRGDSSKESIDKYLKDIDKVDFKLIETDPKNFSSEIIDYTKAKEDTPIQTETVYENDNTMIQMCYLHNNPNSAPVNIIASCLSLNGNQVCGNVVIFSAKMGDDGLYKNISITEDDVRKLVKARFRVMGCKILTDKKITKCEVGALPKTYSDVRMYQFWLRFYYELDEEKPLNKDVTSILGKKVYGDVIVVEIFNNEEDTDSICYIDLEPKTMLRLLNIFQGPISNRNMDKDDLKVELASSRALLVPTPSGGERVNRRTIIKNKWYVLRLKELQYKDMIGKCYNCKKELKVFKICSGCYRIKFCSQECFKKHDCNNL